MIETRKSDVGRILVAGADATDRDRLAGLLINGERHAAVQDFGEVRAYVKASGLSGSSARRHGLRRIFLRIQPPRLREYQNLNWLHARLFQVPRTIAAGVLWRVGLPRHQALVTEWLPEHPTLDDFWRFTDDEQRGAVFDELAREVARMHALRFLHRDLFARNLLVGPDTGRRRVVFLDTWAGGPDPSFRGPAYDLDPGSNRNGCSASWTPMSGGAPSRNDRWSAPACCARSRCNARDYVLDSSANPSDCTARSSRARRCSIGDAVDARTPPSTKFRSRPTGRRTHRSRRPSPRPGPRGTTPAGSRRR